MPGEGGQGDRLSPRACDCGKKGAPEPRGGLTHTQEGRHA